MADQRATRRILHSAYSFIRSIEERKAYSAYTLDHAIQEQIDRLDENSNRDILDASSSIGLRPSRYRQLTDLEDSITALANDWSPSPEDF